MLKSLFLILIFALVSSPAFSAPTCSGTGTSGDPRICASASCASSDIQDAINDAQTYDYGRVTIPSCNTAWSNANKICINATHTDFRINGAGFNSTIITNITPNHSTCGNYETAVEITGNGFKELGNLTMTGNASTGAEIIRYVGCNGIANARIHHVGLKNIATDGMYICSNLNSTLLLDHLYVGDKINANGYGVRVHGNNNEGTWTTPFEGFGTAGPNSGDRGVFVEDCDETISDSDCPGGNCYGFNDTYHPVAGHGSARYVVRHSTFRNYSAGLEGHGPSYSFGCISPCASSSPGADAACYQGVYKVELYNNTFYGGGYANYPRSGHWVVTDNTYNTVTGYNAVITVEMETNSIGSTCAVADGCPLATGWAGSGSCRHTGEGCWHSPQAIYIWGNTFTNCSSAGSSCRTTPTDQNCTSVNDKSTGCIRANSEIFYRAPQVGDPQATSFAKFTYPHPLQGAGSGPSSTAPLSGGLLSGGEVN